MKSESIVMITNASSTCFFFRRELIRDLQQSGYHVSAIVGDGLYQRQIEQLGVKAIVVPLRSRGVNPFALVSYQNKVKKILQKEKPNIVFTFQTKPNIFGVKAAKHINNLSIFSMVEGLGDGFSTPGIKGRLLKFFLIHEYKKTLHFAKTVFVLNKEDFNFLSSQKIVEKTNMVLLMGTGLNCEEYSELPFTNFTTATMISRLIPKKGVFEFCEAARICKLQRKDLRFVLIGKENEINKSQLEPYISDGSICYKGVVDNLKPELTDMSISIVPTYYLEGLPRAIMEAMASGRPVITTKERGCNACIEDGVSGLFINEKDPHDLARKMLWLFERPELIQKMGRSARLFALQNFSSQTIDNKILRELRAKTHDYK